MATDIASSFNPEVLTSLRLQLSLQPFDVASAIGLSTEDYEALESGHEPTSTTIKSLSKFFRVDPFNFYRNTLPKATKRVDFRGSFISHRGDPGPILDAIKYCEGVQKLLLSVVDFAYTWKARNTRKLVISADAEAEAYHWRDHLNVSDDEQLAIKHKHQFFTYVRSKIESHGISVLVNSFQDKNFKGMTYGATEAIPIILINSFRQQRASQTFTLAHELGHVLLERDDISNPYAPEDNTERFCNRFAAALLMPRHLIARLAQERVGTITANSTIKWIANKLKVSMEAVVIRLQDCNLVHRTFWKEWKSQFSEFLPSEEPEGGGGSEDGPDQGIVKLARLGFLFGQHVPSGFRDKGLKSSAIYKASRLKPAYFKALEAAAFDRLAEVASYGGR